MFLRLISLFFYIKKYFNYLPKEIQAELIDTLEDYKVLSRISKSMKGDL